MPGTRCISGRELRQQYTKLGPKKATAHLMEALDKGWLKPSDFSVRDLAENFTKGGREWVNSMNPGKAGNYHLLEAGAVEYGAFSNITGQIFYTAVKEAYEMEQFIFSKLVETKMSTLPDTEKIPGFGDIGDQLETPVKEGDPYPYVGVVEDFIHVGPKRKRGGIIAVTKEAVFGDRTGYLLERCKRIGEFLGYSKEIRIIDTLLDGNAMAASIYAGGSRYHWKNTSYATYQSSTPWINVKTSNALADWTNVQAAELIQAAITDPYTGLPILVEATHIIVPPDLKHTAQRIVTASEVRTTSPGFATSGSPQTYTAPNPVADAYSVVSSRIFKARMVAAGSPFVGASTWLFGNPKKSVAYFANWNAQTKTMGAGSEADFERDVVLRTRVDEKGHPAWLEPRYMVRCVA